MSFKPVLELFKDVFARWGEHKASRLAAALAYYTVFSVAPLLVIIIAIAGFVFGQDQVQDQILSQLADAIGENGANLVNTMIQGAFSQGSGLVATLLGVAGLLFGATGVLNQLQDALDTVWEVRLQQTSGLITQLRKRLVSLGMLLALGFLVLVTLILSAVLTGLGDLISELFPGANLLLNVTNLLISFGPISVLFAMIYKILPNANVAWRDVWVGAIITTILFAIGKWLIGLYLGTVSVGSAYGAAGSLVILLLWVYYSSQILLFGAVITAVYAKRFGSQITSARPLEALDTAEQTQEEEPA